MIVVQEILRMVRFKQKDNNEIFFSDYDIKYALNEALRYIGQSQALQNSDFLLKTKLYSESEVNAKIEEDNDLLEDETEKRPLISFRLDGVDLPDDYQILAGVTRVKDRYNMRPCNAACVPSINEYKVVNNKIYSGATLFNMTYKRTLPAVKNIETDKIDLPEFCTDLITKITGLILNQAETDVLLHAVESTTRAIVPRRRFNNAQTKMPFIV